MQLNKPNGEINTYNMPCTQWKRDTFFCERHLSIKTFNLFHFHIISMVKLKVGKCDPKVY